MVVVTFCPPLTRICTAIPPSSPSGGRRVLLTQPTSQPGPGEPDCLSLAQKLLHLKSPSPCTRLPLPLWNFNKLKVHSILEGERVPQGPSFPFLLFRANSGRCVCPTVVPSIHSGTQPTAPVPHRLPDDQRPDSSLVLSPYNPLPPGLPPPPLPLASTSPPMFSSGHLLHALHLCFSLCCPKTAQPTLFGQQLSNAHLDVLSAP